MNLNTYRAHYSSLDFTKRLIKLKRESCENWDSLAHLEIIFIIEKNSKKKIPVSKLEKLKKGIDIINLIK